MDKLQHIYEGDMIKVRLPNAQRDGLRGPVHLRRSPREAQLIMVPSIWYRNRNSARMVRVPLAYIVAAIHEGVETSFETQEVGKEAQ